MQKIFWINIILLLILKTTLGQFYDSGQDPNRIKWRQFNSSRFQVIYPSGLDSLAKVYFLNLERIANQELKTISFSPTKIPVVLHNQTIISNGEVGWAPKRMNLYLVAGQDNYFQPWEQHLPIHEYRHTAQLGKMNQGTSRVLFWVFGEQATAAILGWHIPMWFVEGDAVAFETGSSNAGRGRIPDFSMKLEAQLTEKGIYSYPKAMFGSYKDFVPNRYELGYQLVGEGRNTYGYEIWNRSLDRVARKPFHINPFSEGIKEVSGLSERLFYFETMQKLKTTTEKRTLQNGSKETLVFPEKPMEYSNYFCPKFLNNNILAYKTSLKGIPCFVVIDSLGNEQKLFYPGYVFDDTFSSTDSLMVWNELNTTRWENATFSRVAIYDFQNKKVRYLLNEGRVFHSRLSNDSKSLLSVEVNEQIKWKITIRSVKDGALLDSYLMDTLQPVQPDWSPDNSKIAFVAISKNGKSLGVLNLDDGIIEWILKNELLEISNPKITESGIWVKGVYNNTSNYYYYDFNKHQWQIATHEPFGVNEGNVTNDKFLYSTYTSAGHRICSLMLTDHDSMIIAKPTANASPIIQRLASEERLLNFSDSLAEFESTEYKKSTHLFNFHSWAPLAIRVENQEIGWGVSAMSQNVLSTSFLTIGYQYHAADEYQEYFLDYQYKGFYPIIDNKYGLIPFSFYYPDRDTILREISGIQQQFAQNWLIPFNFNKGPWYRLLQPEFGYTFTSNYYHPNEYFNLTDRYQHKFAYRLYSYNLLRQSHRDMYSKWGQSVYLQLEQVPFDKNKGYLMAVSGQFYFPGIAPNHSFRIYGGYQIKDDGDIPFYVKILYPRGYTATHNDEMISSRFEYAMPLIYPDLNLKELFYLKRIRLNLFYDIARYKFEEIPFKQESTGIDLGFDFHAFRFIAPIDFMLRYGYKMVEKESFYEIKFKLDFNALYGVEKQEVRK